MQQNIFHYSATVTIQEERLRVKDEHPELSITEVAKELGRRWAILDPSLKHSYEQRYQVSNMDR